MLSFSDEQLQAKAAELDLIPDASSPVPNRDRGRVAAALAEEQRATTPRATPVKPRLAKNITVQPDGVILVDGEPFPWLVAKEPMDVRLAPEDCSTVRLTLLTETVQIIKPESEKTS